jgi:hypothetical protein
LHDGKDYWDCIYWQNNLKLLQRDHCTSHKRVDVKQLHIGTDILCKTGYLFAVWGTLKTTNNHTHNSNCTISTFKLHGTV